MTLHTQTVLSLCGAAVLLSACGESTTTAVSHALTPTTTSPAPTPVTTIAPFPSAAGHPPFTPPPATSQPPGIDAGAPPISYAIPPQYSINISTPQEVQLTSVSGAEALGFAVDPSSEDLASATDTLSVGGERGYVLHRGPDAGGFGYSEVVIVDHAGVQYELSCIGYSGYDASRLSQGCAAFAASITFTA